MDVEGVDGERGAAAQEAVEVDVGDDVAGRAAAGEAEDALQVAADGDGRLREPLERHTGRPAAGAGAATAPSSAAASLRSATRCSSADRMETTRGTGAASVP